ncbi:dTDP-glucose 4,6-dehydratase [Granulicella rosea]|uniref:dTDP-glucose 4,6-dehydratase n=1 Tax=Granulicella rosea TaxID=474952 RepID=A0A239IXQ5_9BACT|nr:NAD-dependent epimerase/dehydratase family protein [Granulicella rosea]SNS98407.1 dTDP-glucose 4,6-dehydratase [Granulicella rosea]
MPPLPQEDLDLILRETAPLWDELRSQRIFLTGGTGFFGCWLVESFLHINRALRLNASITVLTRGPEAFARKCPHLVLDTALTLVKGDVRTFDPPIGSYAYVIHAATAASAAQLAEEPLAMLSTILDGTARVLEFAATHGARKLLLTSSGAVYGRQPAGLSHIGEDYTGAPNPLDPASVYAEGKRTSELMCALLASSVPVEIKIARCFAFVGPHLPLDTHFAIGNFIADALAGRPIRIAGDGTPARSYLYAADLAIWLWTMLLRAPSLEAFNVGSEEALSIRDLARSVAQILNPATEIHVARAPGAGPQHRYIPSTQKAQTKLNLKQHVPFEEAIRRTAEWHSAQER